MMALQGFLEVKSIDYGGEHPGVVRGRPFHAGGLRFRPAHYVAASDDNRNLNTKVIDTFYLGRDILDGCGVDSEIFFALEGFSAQL